ncbi:uncharacterized protein LOC124139555 [Haliotis rufescens]|uniref:uncharacterized protein LOC124139555 n=1 Tax=Haliotis rufescens TaxID=6454 RepID=UPI00201F6EF6|nr:uncharacterized protein LOC124139555 [Haliotis rufescens]
MAEKKTNLDNNGKGQPTIYITNHINVNNYGDIANVNTAGTAHGGMGHHTGVVNDGMGNENTNTTPSQASKNFPFTEETSPCRGEDHSRKESGPKLQMDAARANTGWCHVTTDGQLVNSPRATRHKDRGRLQEYRGTCSSTPIPLPPPRSNVIPAPHIHRYWETHSRVGVQWGVYVSPVLEMGVVEESQVDREMHVCQQRRSWGVSVGSCRTHWGRFCTRVWLEGDGGKCYRNTLSYTPGTQATLHYGVVLDVGRGRVAFIDLDRKVVLAKTDVEFQEALLPLFGVGRPDLATVKMKLISGEEIDMTDTKISLINKVLA